MNKRGSLHPIQRERGPRIQTFFHIHSVCAPVKTIDLFLRKLANKLIAAR